MEKAEKFGYDLAEVEAYLRKLGSYNPLVFVKSAIEFFNYNSDIQELKNWLRFRCDFITEHVEDVRDVVKSANPKVEVGGAVFAPSLAPLVGQNYADLCKVLDFIQPMVYHRGDGIACVNYEMARLVEGCLKDERDQENAIESIC